MTTDTTVAVAPREPELPGQIVVTIGGSAGIGLETARSARAEGTEVILTGRNPERLERADRFMPGLLRLTDSQVTTTGAILATYTRTP
jgi:NADP-dependent 3-hydroxy acid dehydrogenase YdfG